MILFLLYHRYVLRFFEAQPALAAKTSKQAFGFYAAFLRDWNHFFDLPDRTLPSGHQPAHTFACFSQLSRAFLQIFTCIIGSSLSAKTRLAGGPATGSRTKTIVPMPGVERIRILPP